MGHTPHELHDEFPDHAGLLHDLKVSDSHFKFVSERYHEVNRAIHRIEVEVEHASDTRLEDLKKQRLSILDEVSQMLTKAKSAV